MVHLRYTAKLLLTCSLLLLFTISGLGQTYNPFNQRDDQYRLLGLKRAKQAYEVAQSEWERQQTLFQQEHITQRELDAARNIFTDAEVNYQQSLLAVLFEEQYITITEAVKYQDPDGSRRVRLTIANTSGGTAEFRKLLNVDDQLFRSLQPDVISNVYVSILNEDNAIISQPYEAKIDDLRHGEPRQIDFSLLQDLDEVTVFMVFANGAQRQMKIFLQKDASANRVLVQSEQFSQEVELGESASFDLTLELYSGISNTFSLEVVNLPQSIDRFFKAPIGDARLSQLKFTESSRTKHATLEVSLPDRPTGDVIMDQAIPFFALVLPRDKKEQLGSVTDRNWTEDELRDLDVGFVRLEILPRGKGKILVRSPQLYHSIQPGGTVDMSVDILNEGSNRLDNIEVRADIPLNWDKTILPLSIATLGINEETRVSLAFTPPEDITPGKYEVRLRTSATSNSQPITGLDKTVTIEVRAETNVFVTIVIILLVIGLVGGIVVFGIRLSRR